MQPWQAIVLGFVQGFGEFLPISSSGHLMLLQHWFGIEEAFFYSVMLHVGTLIPAVIVLWKEIISLLKKPFKKFWCLVLATIPAGIIGIIFSKILDVDELFNENIYLLAITFTITAILLLFAEWRAKKVDANNPVNVKTALIMGSAQAFGVLPGISRSGSTLTGGIIAKVDRNSNATFTFLMSIPIIVAAAVLEMVDVVQAGAITNINWFSLSLGMVTAAISGYVAISSMIKVIKKANYKWFSLYLIVIAIITLVTA